MHQTSIIQSWRDLAQVIVHAVDHLAAADPVYTAGCDIVLMIAPGLDSLLVKRDGSSGSGVRIQLCNLPRTTDIEREDGAWVPCGSIDRAASKAAADMLAWHQDPETFELVETRRHRLLLQWPHGEPEVVYEWAYGLWDE